MARLLTGKGNYCGALLFSERHGTRGAAARRSPAGAASARPAGLAPAPGALAARPIWAPCCARRRASSAAARWCSWSPISSASRAGRRRSALWRAATRWWRSGCSTRRKRGCRISACSPFRTPKPASRSLSTPMTAGSAGVSPPPRNRPRTLCEPRSPSAGVDCLELSTEDDLLDAFVRFAQMRKQRHKTGVGGVRPHSRGHSSSADRWRSRDELPQ